MGDFFAEVAQIFISKINYYSAFKISNTLDVILYF